MSTHQVARREAAELTFMLRQSNISIFFDMKYLFLIRQCLKQFVLMVPVVLTSFSPSSLSKFIAVKKLSKHTS